MAAVRVEPGVDVVGVEAQQVPPLEVGDASLGDEAPDVAMVHPESLGDGWEVHEALRCVVGGG